MVISMFASAVVTYEVHIRHKTMKEIMLNVKNFFFCQRDLNQRRSKVESPVAESETTKVELRRVEKFFVENFGPFVDKAKYPIILTMSILGILAILKASQLGPLLSEEYWFPEDHFLIKSLIYARSGFTQGENDAAAILEFAWGINGLDLSDYRKFDTNKNGEVDFDSTFDMSSEQAQQHLYDFCQNLKSHHGVFKTNSTASVSCFMDDFSEWANSSGYGFPVSEPNFLIQFKNWSKNVGTDYISSGMIGWDPNDETLRFVIVEAVTTLPEKMTYDSGYPEYKVWEEFQKEQNSKAPEGVSNGKHIVHFDVQMHFNNAKFNNYQVFNLPNHGQGLYQKERSLQTQFKEVALLCVLHSSLSLSRLTMLSLLWLQYFRLLA